MRDVTSGLGGDRKRVGRSGILDGWNRRDGRRSDTLQLNTIPVSGHRYTPDLVSNYQDSRQQRENRRRIIVRVVCVVIAVAMLGSLVIPAIYAGL
ncbi:hypothetical protein [Bifidobacterium olomucense]|uniref:hypothetical protein n=1 Tax=Bifidobacterium olomucense TaxID=2675324 RepID=UPI00145DFE76|nr:hypothetical protein [Bifidobacterium sp. DSM 109959]